MRMREHTPRSSRSRLRPRVHLACQLIAFVAIMLRALAATAADVTSVVVSGRQVVRDGRHLLVDDVPGALARAIAALDLRR